MKPLIIILAVLLISAAIFYFFFYTPGLSLHAIEIQDESGQKVEIKTGKPTVVCFFQTWCSDCVRETPMVYQVAQDQGANLYLISDEDWEKMNKYKDRFEVPLTLYHSTLKLDQYKIMRYPTLFIYDSRGKLVRTFVESVTKEQLEDVLQKTN